MKNSLFTAQEYFFDHSKVHDCGFAVLQCCGRAVSPVDISELHDRFALRARFSSLSKISTDINGTAFRCLAISMSL
jgi:hypothetical protein